MSDEQKTPKIEVGDTYDPKSSMSLAELARTAMNDLKADQAFERRKREVDGLASLDRLILNEYVLVKKTSYGTTSMETIGAVSLMGGEHLRSEGANIKECEKRMRLQYLNYLTAHGIITDWETAADIASKSRFNVSIL